MEINQSNPAEVVGRIRAGERSAEDELVRQYSRGVYFVINQSVMDSAQVDDIYQETFRLVLEKVRAGQVREPERLSGFILSIARNLVIEQFRKNVRAEVGNEAYGRSQVASPEISQLDQLLRQEQAALARRVLAALESDRDRKILFRFYIADDDKEEICADLGVSSMHFNQILCRARERYRKLFDEMKPERQK